MKLARCVDCHHAYNRERPRGCHHCHPEPLIPNKPALWYGNKYHKTHSKNKPKMYDEKPVRV